MVDEYTPEVRRLAKAATVRYGVRPAQRLCDRALGFAPLDNLLRVWAKDEAIVVTESDTAYWTAQEVARRRAFDEQVADRLDKALAIFDHFADSRHPDARALKDVTQLLVALYDRVIPPERQQGPVLVGAVENMQLLMVAPHDYARARPLEALEAPRAPHAAPLTGGRTPLWKEDPLSLGAGSQEGYAGVG